MHQGKPVAVCGEICGWQRVYFFVRKVKKSGTRTPWNSRRWFLVMEKNELIDTGGLTEKQARLKHGKVCRVSGKDDPEVRGCGP